MSVNEVCISYVQYYQWVYIAWMLIKTAAAICTLLHRVTATRVDSFRFRRRSSIYLDDYMTVVATECAGDRELVTQRWRENALFDFPMIKQCIILVEVFTRCQISHSAYRTEVLPIIRWFDGDSVLVISYNYMLLFRRTCLLQLLVDNLYYNQRLHPTLITYTSTL